MFYGKHFAVACLGLMASFAIAAEPTSSRQQLSSTYFSEGANAGDLNQDGKPDVVCGPFWYEGPEFTKSHEIYPPKPQPLDFYADNFFSWVHDVNRDGRNDVFVVGFPGTPAFVYENPGKKAGHWPKHQVFDSVSNESPHFTQLVGDETPELVCTRNGRFGFATLPAEGSFSEWKFHSISDQAAPERFGHGLGVGDINGDKKLDILTAGGWFEQPATDPEGTTWSFHEAKFTNSYGGAEMYAYDVDGDGDNDVITSLAAHDFGLAWYEQDTTGTKPIFREHTIMGKTPEQSHYGLVFTELHSVALVDMNGDGLKDIVTGKTYWSHHKQSPMWDAGAVVYSFELKRDNGTVDWIPHLLDDESGIGRQLSVADLNGDQRPDIVVGGMKGAHVLRRPATGWSQAAPQATQPRITPLQRAKSALSADQTNVPGAIEAEDTPQIEVSEVKTSVQEMTGFPADRWSGGKQLFCSEGKPGSQIRITFNVANAGRYDLRAAMTMAPDFAVVRVLVDGTVTRQEIDLYNTPDVISTGPLTLSQQQFTAGPHVVTVEITGKNPSSKGMLIGIDYLQLLPVSQP
jgi:hypothetical protein